MPVTTAKMSDRDIHGNLVPEPSLAEQYKEAWDNLHRAWPKGHEVTKPFPCKKLNRVPGDGSIGTNPVKDSFWYVIDPLKPETVAQIEDRIVREMLMCSPSKLPTQDILERYPNMGWYFKEDRKPMRMDEIIQSMGNALGLNKTIKGENMSDMQQYTIDKSDVKLNGYVCTLLKDGMPVHTSIVQKYVDKKGWEIVTDYLDAVENTKRYAPFCDKILLSRVAGYLDVSAMDLLKGDK